MTKLLTTNEVADVLRCNKITVIRMVKNNELKPIRMGSRFLFKQEEIEEFITKNTIE